MLHLTRISGKIKNKVAWVSPSATPAAPIAAPTWLHLGFPCNLIYKCPARRTREKQQQEQELCKVPHHTKATKREREQEREGAREERPNEKDINKRMRDEPSEESPLAGLSNDWMFIIMMMLIMMMMLLQSAQLKIEIFKFLKLNWNSGGKWLMHRKRAYNDWLINVDNTRKE